LFGVVSGDAIAGFMGAAFVLLHWKFLPKMSVYGNCSQPDCGFAAAEIGHTLFCADSSRSLRASYPGEV
jgi:hypothetical protein